MILKSLGIFAYFINLRVHKLNTSKPNNEQSGSVHGVLRQLATALIVQKQTRPMQFVH